MIALPIDVVSDIVCPWCFIGARRLEQALAPLAPEVSAKITYRPFLLDPSTPTEGTDLRERLRTKYRVDPSTMFARVESAARASGIRAEPLKRRIAELGRTLGPPWTVDQKEATLAALVALGGEGDVP